MQTRNNDVVLIENAVFIFLLAGLFSKTLNNKKRKAQIQKAPTFGSLISLRSKKTVSSETDRAQSHAAKCLST